MNLYTIFRNDFATFMNVFSKYFKIYIKKAYRKETL